MQEILKLPLQLQAILVAGFLGYLIFKRDHRKTEKPTEMWLLVLLFGLPTAGVLNLVNSPYAYFSILIAPILAVIWLKFFDVKWSKLLYKYDISHTMNEGDVWKTLSSTKGIAASQIILKHKNGKHYLCQATADFNGMPFSPFTMDDDGIAFYVTHIFDKEADDWVEISDVILQPEYGSKITYFPKADIELLEMRFTRYTKK